MKVVAVLLIFAFCSSPALSRRIQSRNILGHVTEAVVRESIETGKSGLGDISIPDEILGPVNDILAVLGIKLYGVELRGMSELVVESVGVNSLVGLIVEDLDIGLQNLSIVAKVGNVELHASPIVNVTVDEAIEIGLSGIKINVGLSMKGDKLGSLVLDRIEDVRIDIDSADIIPKLDGALSQTELVLTDFLKNTLESLVNLLENVVPSIIGGLLPH